MKKIINALRMWWSNFTMSSEELYLSQSSDHVDLEHRMRNIMDGNHSRIYVDPIFNTDNMGKHRYY